MTGWGQDGPLARSAGHDINYIALAGVLHGIGRAGQPPVPPLNLIGDYGGGGLLLAFGVVCALLEARTSGRGQVVDAAMVDGAALFTTVLHELIARGAWTEQRGANILDGGTPWYACYETADGRYLAVGALEPRFYARLVDLLGADLPRETLDGAELRDRLTALFRQRTQREWCDLLEGTDACCAPVLAPTEAPGHPHNQARQSYLTVDGTVAARAGAAVLAHARRGPVPAGASRSAHPRRADRAWVQRCRDQRADGQRRRGRGGAGAGAMNKMSIKSFTHSPVL